MQIPKGLLQAVKGKGTGITKARKEQTMTYKTIYRTLKIERHKLHYENKWNKCKKGYVLRLQPLNLSV